jgi:geranyl-CoA carboxylase beta subunit
VPADEREPYDVREVIARLVDGSDFLEFKAEYAADTVCGHARIARPPVGILGNNGPIQPSGSTKAAQFIQLCDQSGTPLVFLQNTTGYMVGKAAERRRRHQARQQDDPGRGQCPRAQVHHRARRLLWRRQLRHVRARLRPALHLQLAHRPHRRDGRRAGRQGDGHRQPRQDRARRHARQRRSPGRHERRPAPAPGQAESAALFGTARLWDDGVIDPRDTRRVLALCLAMAAEAQARPLRPNTFGVARM